MGRDPEDDDSDQCDLAGDTWQRHTPPPRRTNPSGIPAAIPVDRPSKRHVSQTEQLEQLEQLAGHLTGRVAKLEQDDDPPSEDRVPEPRRKRQLRLPAWITAGGIMTALGAAVGAIKSAIDSARAAERTQVRLEFLERKVERLEQLDDARRAAERGVVTWPPIPRRRDEQPDPPASTPAPKGPPSP